MPDPDSVDQPDIELPEQTPATGAEMFALIKSVQSKTLGKQAQLVDSISRETPGGTLQAPEPETPDSADDGEGLYFGLAIARFPKLLGVRVNITHKDETVQLRSDISIEYTWTHPVAYLDDALIEFVSNEGIPRALTTAAAILSDVAASVGRNIENSSVRMQSDLIEYFQRTFNGQTWGPPTEKSQAP